MADEAGRRSACDRCRRQKLRCVRPEPDQSCERCRKSRINCCTSQSSYRAGFSTSSSSGSMRTSQLSSHSSTSNTGSAHSSRLSSVAPSNISDDVTYGVRPRRDSIALNMTGLDRNIPTHIQMQSFDSFSNSPNVAQDQPLREIDPSGLTDDLSTANCFDNMIIEELFQTPIFSSSSCGESPKSVSNLQPPVGTARAIRTSDEVLGNAAIPPSPLQEQRMKTPLAIVNGRRPASELASRVSTPSVSSNNIKLYTTQILDLHRCSTRKTDGYMATRRSSTDMAADMRMESTRSRAAASKHFMETLFGDSQAFLAILRHIQACTQIPATHISSGDQRNLKYGAQVHDSVTPYLGGSDGAQLPPRYSLADDGARPHALDFQSSLAIISYYAHIIHAYDVVFQDILRFMTDVGPEDLATDLPHYIPEVYVGAVRLVDQPELQLESLINACSAILESIDSTLGLGSTTSSNRTLNGAQPQCLLLDALLRQSDLAYEKTDGTREARVKRTIYSIRRILNLARKKEGATL